MGKSSSKKLKRRARRLRKLIKLYNRAHSDWCEFRDSEIHGRGGYARSFIPAETCIIEYVGELIDKSESESRAWAQFDRSEQSGEAAVFIFTLSERWDLDGSVPWNNARLLNHSCEPNCEARIAGKRIFIYALRDIEPGEELLFDYGFDVSCYEDHPCRCGTPSCVCYIVSRGQWPELKRLLAGGAPREDSAAEPHEQPDPGGENKAAADGPSGTHHAA
jgi:hypothetical protein